MALPRLAGPSPRRWGAAILPVLALGALLGLRLLSDNTLEFHLRGGRWILEHGAFPGLDPFTYGAAGREYLDLHWLFQVALFGLYRVVGYAGLSVAGALLTVLLLALLGLRMRRLGAGPAASAWVLLAAAVAMHQRYLMRPENVSFVLLVLLGLILDAHLGRSSRRPPGGGAGGASRGGGSGLLLAVPLLHLVWANTQGLFVLGWIVVGAGWLAASVSARRPDRPLGLTLAASVLVCLANPYGVRGLLFPLQLLSRFDRANVFARHVGEFQPLWEIGRLFEDFVLYGLMLATAAALALTWRRRRPDELLLPIPFLCLALVAVRNVPLFVIVAAPILARSLSELGALLREAFPAALSASRARLAARAGGALFALIACGLAVRVLTGAFYLLPGGESLATFGVGLDRRMRPVAAAEFLQRAGLSGRVLNSSNIGGWLGWALPQPVFMDMRLEVMGEELYGREVESWSAGGLAPLLERYGPQLVAFDYRGGAAGWVDQLRQRKDWRLIFVDGVVAIYAKEGYAPALPPLAPGDLPSRLGLAPPPDAGALERIFARPVPGRASRWLAGFVRRTGRDCALEPLGHFCLLAGAAEAAERLFLACLAADPDAGARLYGELGTLYATTQRPALALRCLDQHLRFHPRDAGRFNERGIVRVMLGDLPGAIADFSRSARLEPRAAQALANRGLARLQASDPRGALADFEGALALEPGNAMALEGRATAQRLLEGAQGR